MENNYMHTIFYTTANNNRSISTKIINYIVLTFDLTGICGTRSNCFTFNSNASLFIVVDKIFQFYILKTVYPIKSHY